MASPLEQFDALPLISFFFFGKENLLNLTFFSILLPLVFSILLIKIVDILFRFNIKLFLFNSVEYIINILTIFLFNMIKQKCKTSKDYIMLQFYPFLLTIFLFILLSNYISLIPCGIALTSHLIIILWLSLTLISGIFCFGLTLHGFSFLKLFIPHSPFLMLPLLIIIELLSYILRGFSLALRLSANIMAGHTLVFIISAGLLKILSLSLILSSIVVVILILLFFLEFGVAFLQSYVFATLIIMYLFDAWYLEH